MLSTGERLLITLWVGSLWAIGFMAVPLAFIHFDDVIIAGDYAGKLFYVVNIISFACGSALLLTFAFSKMALFKSWRFWLVALMLIFTAFSHFYLNVEMAAIKVIDDWRETIELANQFDQLHHISSTVFGLISLLGLALVVSTDQLHDVKG